MPGYGEQTLLFDVSSAVPGTGYYQVTKDLWKITCVSSTRNGYPGEAFIATSPEGVSYRLDHVITKPYPRLIKRVGNYSASVAVDRSIVYFLVSRIEDRHGNYVAYQYSGDRLASITSSDGRAITVSGYSGGRYTQIQSSVGLWNYQYLTNGARVIRPDGSRWVYETTGALHIEPTADLPVYMGQPLCPAPPLSSGEFGIAITHPSGARGEFNFGIQRHFRHNIPKLCNSFLDMAGPSTSYQFLTIPNFNDSFTIRNRVVTGPGLSPMRWDYQFGIGGSGLAFEENCPGSSSLACPKFTETRVVGPGGTYDRYQFGAWFQYNDGLLLRHDSGSINGSGSVAILKSVENDYVLPGDGDFSGFPLRIGRPGSSRLDNVAIGYIIPLRESITHVSGVSFRNRLVALDGLARPTQMRRGRSDQPASEQAVSMSYYDNVPRWVLGSIANESMNGRAVSRTTFNSSGMPESIYSFGRLAQTLRWNPDGTVQSVTDGNNNTTRFSDWRRGIPQLIQFPATPEASSGAMLRSVVNNEGRIASVTDESGHTTSYSYDPMGRVSRIKWPTGDTTVWNDTVHTFEQVTNAEFGLGGQHWRRTTSRGNARTVSYFDALWRPVLTHEFDAGDIAGTQRFRRYSYDHGGRTTFAAYPSDRSNASTGIWIEYDAIGRATSTTQDSELGPLTTVTEYLPGFLERVTTPKGLRTTTRFLGWHQPTTDYPTRIDHPGGVVTEVERDIFGKPTRISRRDASATTSLVRNYVYDNFQQLCKSVEPETGATIVAYDSAGNVSWTRSGSPLTSTAGCNTADVPVAERTRRVYDARHRIQSLLFPDGLGNTKYDYTPTGHVAQMVVANGGSGVATTVYTRNKLGMVTGEAMGVGDVAWGLGYGFDGNGHLATQVYPVSNRVVDYAPNALGQATRAGTFAYGASYFPDGRLKRFTYGNGIVRTVNLNSRFFPERIRDAFGSSVAYDDSFDYDGHGNVVGISDGLPSRRGDRTMNYDEADRLTRVNSSAFGAATYGYDALDNLRSVSVSGGPRVRQHSYRYDAANRLSEVRSAGGATLSSLTYDSRGNIGNRDGRSYVFDAGNRLREVRGVESYRYDGHGRRVQSLRNGLSIYSMYGHDGVLRYQRDEHGAVTREHVYLSGAQVAQIEQIIQLASPSLTLPQFSDVNRYTVRWSAVAGASRYELEERAGSSAWARIHNAPQTSAAVSGRAAGLLSYRVRACSASATCGAWSQVATIAVMLPPQASPLPTAPATALGGSYTVSWNQVLSANRYELEERIGSGAWTPVQNSAVLARAFSGRGAGTYGYRIRACNGAGCSQWSGVANVTVVVVPASAPTISGPTSNHTGSYAITWTSIQTATRYELQRSADGTRWDAAQNTSATSWSASNQAAGAWRHRVRACNAAGCTGFSGTHTVTVVRAPVGQPALTAPASINTSSATISWSAVAAASSYEVRRRFNQGGWQALSTTPNRSLSLSGLVTGSYEHQVRACNVAGCSAYSESRTTNVTLPPSSAPVVSAPSASATEFTVSWTAVAAATHYRLEHRLDGGNWTAGGQINGLSLRMFPPTGIYSYRVHACNAVGCGPYSNIVTVNVLRLPPPPVCPGPGGCPVPHSANEPQLEIESSAKFGGTP